AIHNAVDHRRRPETKRTQRLAQVEQTIDHFREQEGDRHTPVLVAAGGPRARALAAAKADIVTLAVGPLADRAELATVAAELRETAGDRADQLELMMNLFGVGDEVPPWIEQFLGVDAATMVERDSLSLLRGNSPREMADELERRRDALGVSYISVNAAFVEQLAP